MATGHVCRHQRSHHRRHLFTCQICIAHNRTHFVFCLYHSQCGERRECVDRITNNNIYARVVCPPIPEASQLCTCVFACSRVCEQAIPDFPHPSGVIVTADYHSAPASARLNKTKGRLSNTRTTQKNKHCFTPSSSIIGAPSISPSESSHIRCACAQIEWIHTQQHTFQFSVSVVRAVLETYGCTQYSNIELQNKYVIQYKIRGVYVYNYLLPRTLITKPCWSDTPTRSL